ncbi:YheC/YheD family protein [Bacillus luteolus]|uniref:YheC/YheD family protein n=1 Tax=Litchfieldia luteola TaxID=682179 RepID=A0ABR9QGG7_9BACI|nr:YheC/YheD family protein [Cytobacillus luteolus]MBE4907585.1 YheC/YheD family protein [Cytobacillus luteolus]MBP1944360.1 hypothetical protein [Cytobacillus luteolus]
MVNLKKYNILYKKYYKRKIRLSKNFIQEFNLTSKVVTLKIGQWSKQFNIIESNVLSDDTIGLPKSKIPFTLPANLTYEIKVEDNMIHIGPIIGILAKQKSNFKQYEFKKYNSRLRNYNEINGVVFLCSEAGINMEERTIKGYYYNPNARNKKMKWQEGIFPYPDSFFKRVRIQKVLQKELLNQMGDTIFNSHYFDKLKLWEVCSGDSEAKKLLPESRFYKNQEDIEDMVEKHDQVYIKPIRGMQGIGIIRIEKKDDQYIITDGEGNKVKFPSINNTMDYLNTKLTNKHGYILQQGIPTLYKDKHTDFRFYFQKNKNKEWICQGTVGRVAKENRIVTNYKHLSGLLSGNKAIQLLFQTDSNHAQEILNKTIEDCMIICQLIEKEMGHYGDIVFDVVIDENKKTWVLEINNRIYGLKSLQRLKKFKMLRKILTTPIEYAKALTNF